MKVDLQIANCQLLIRTLLSRTFSQKNLKKNYSCYKMVKQTFSLSSKTFDNLVSISCRYLQFLFRYLPQTTCLKKYRFHPFFFPYLLFIEISFSPFFINYSTTTEAVARRCSKKQVLLKFLQNSHKNTCAGVYFQYKVAGPQA